MKIKPSQPSSHTYSSNLPKKTKEPSLSAIVSKAFVPFSTKPTSLAGRVTTNTPTTSKVSARILNAAGLKQPTK